MIISSNEFLQPSLTYPPSFSTSTYHIIQKCGFDISPTLATPLQGRVDSLSSLSRKLQNAYDHSFEHQITCLIRTTLSITLLAGAVFASLTLSKGAATLVIIGLFISSFALRLYSTQQAELELKGLGGVMALFPPLGPLIPLYEMLTKIPNLQHKIKEEQKSIETYKETFERFLLTIDKKKLEQILLEKNQELSSISDSINALPENTLKEVLKTKKEYKLALKELMNAIKYYKIHF